MEHETLKAFPGRIHEYSKLEIDTNKLYRWFRIDFEEPSLIRYIIKFRVNVYADDKYSIGQKVEVDLTKEDYNNLIWNKESEGTGQIHFYE